MLPAISPDTDPALAQPAMMPKIMLPPPMPDPGPPPADMGAPPLPDVPELAPQPAAMPGASDQVQQDAAGLNAGPSPAHHQAMLHEFGAQKLANLGDRATLSVHDPDFIPKLMQSSAAYGKILHDEGQYKEMTPWGSPDSAHPGIGGKIGHALGTIGNVAGNALLGPQNMSLIPGSQANIHAEGAQGDQEIAGAAKGLEENAVTNKTNAEAENVGAPKEGGTPDAQFLAAQQRINQGLGTPADKATVDAYTKLKQAGQDIKTPPLDQNGVAQHNQQLQTLTAGMDPEEAQRFNNAYGAKPGETADVARKRLDDAQKAVQMSTNERDRKLQRDQQQKNHEESMAAIAATRAANEQHKSKAEDVKARQEISKIYQPVSDSAERYNVMTQNLRDGVQNHDQQAMLSLLANHIGMTMGLQKGARITQAILDEAQKSLPFLQGVKAKFDSDGYLSGVTLSPEQMHQMVGLARGRYREDVQKARNGAKYAGAEDDGPDRTPSQSTMHYYLDQTKGNVQQAKKLAADDGWTVK